MKTTDSKVSRNDYDGQAWRATARCACSDCGNVAPVMKDGHGWICEPCHKEEVELRTARVRRLGRAVQVAS